MGLWNLNTVIEKPEFETQIRASGQKSFSCRLLCGYIPHHSVWTPFHSMYENSTLCRNWFVHQANTTGAFIVHQGNAAGAFIVHQGNVVEHFGSYIKAEWSSPTVPMQLSTWINFRWILLETFFSKNVFVKFQVRFGEWDFKVKFRICYISGTNGTIGFRSGFSRREISSVYLWCWWQRTKIERQNSMRNLWIKS